jgi:hypothetical protein
MDQSKVYPQWDKLINLNINLSINNERQDCKIGTVCVWGRALEEGGRVNEGD